MIPISSSRLPRRSVQSCDGGTFASQSTTRPSIEKSIASNTPIAAVKIVIASRIGRRPSVHSHMNATKRRGGDNGAPSGYADTRRSNQRNNRLSLADTAGSSRRGADERWSGSKPPRAGRRGF